MPQVELNSPAPDFKLQDYRGNKVRLSQFVGKQNVLLVFNRGFT
jgi:peroxiredoxin